MKLGLFTRKKKRAQLIKNIIADVVRTGFGPPPEFFTLSELEELNTAVARAEEYDGLFATIEYPEILQEGREISFDNDRTEIEQNISRGGYNE